MRKDEEMLVKDIPTGKVFAIEGTKSYPKLKLGIGYIDMRDHIIGKPENTDWREAEIMELDELCQRFEATPNEIHAWIGENFSYANSN